MTINVADNNPRINYTATSGQTVFTVPFEFFASTDLTVYVDGSVLSASDYTVTGGSGSTGSITTDSGQTTGAEIAIVRDVPLERTTDLTSTYSASSLNDQLDRLVTQVADLDDRVSRSISLNDYEVGVSLDLPAKASRLGKTVQFNSTTGALEIGPSGNELTSIASIASEITALDGIKTNITTVAGAISNVNSVGSNISSVTSVAGSISNVNTVNTNIANVNLVGASISDVNDVADSIDQVEVVAASIDNVDAVALLSSNIGVVISVYDEIQTVASDFTKINTVAGITGAISTVNSNATNINLAATNIDDINDVANVITKVTSVADNIANVNAVAPSVSYLSTVANNISSVNTVATNIGSISAVNTNISDVTTISASITNVNTVADNISLINDFSQKYRIGSSDPLANNDEGDLFYNTTSNALKVYTGSAWEQGVTAGSGFLPLSGGGLSGNLSFVDNAKAIFGSGSDLQIYHDGQNSYISDQGAGQLTILASNFEVKNPDGSQSMFFGAQGNVASLYYAGSAKLLTESSGVDILGTLKSDGLWVEGDSRIGAHNGTNYDLFYDTSDSQLEFADNAKAVFGNGSDLQIYHDEVNSYVTDAGTGDLRVSANNLRLQNADNSANYIKANNGSNVELFFNNAPKLATTSTGVDITGNLTADYLAVGTTSDSYSQILINSSTTGESELRMGDTDTDAGSVSYTNSNDTMTFRAAAGARMALNSTGLDVTGILTSDGLTVDGGANLLTRTSSGAEIDVLEVRNNATAASTASAIKFVNSTASGSNSGSTELIGIRTGTNTGDFKIRTSNSSAAMTDRMLIDSNGDISFYEDTGSSPKFFWDASAETLDIGGGSSSAVLDVVGSVQNDWALRAENTQGSEGWGALIVASASTSTEKAFEVRKNTSDTAMLIDGSGNVGIGNTSPSSYNAGSKTLVIGDGGTEGISIHAGTGMLHFTNGADTTERVSIKSTVASNTLEFTTGGSEAMRIDSSGNVGIGTDSPNSYTANGNNLVVADVNVGITLASTSTVGSGALYFADGTSGSQAYRGIINYLHASDAMGFHTGASERMRITSAGNVGIGFSTTNAKLNVLQSLSGTYGSAGVWITDNATTSMLMNNTGAGVSSIWASGALTFGSGSNNNTERMRIDSSGNVGIGTTTPASILDIKGSTGNSVITLNSASAIDAYPSIGKLRFYSNDNSTNSSGEVGSVEVIGIGTWNGAANNAAMTFNLIQGLAGTTSPVEAMRIDSSGNLLVGKTVADTTTLGNTVYAGIVSATMSGDPAIFANRAQDGSIIELQKSGAPVGVIGVNNTDNLFITGKSDHCGLEFTGVNIIAHKNGANPNDTIDLGSSSVKFDDVFATNGTIQTSDENEKQNITSLTSAEITAATAISKLFKTFKWKSKVAAKGDNARTHTGVIAQQVQTALTDAGLDASKYAFWCSDTWTNDDGNEQTRMGIRYSELLAFIGAATEQRLTDIETRLAALEG